MRKVPQQSGRGGSEDEFLWLVSLSDLMILLFVFFVVLFTFSYKKMTSSDFQKIMAYLRSEAEPIQQSGQTPIAPAPNTGANNVTTF